MIPISPDAKRVAIDADRKKTMADPMNLVEEKTYRRVIGSLMYLFATKPDITFAVSLLSRFQSKPHLNHYECAMKILKYIKSTLHLGLLYKKGTNLTLEGFSDTNFAGDNSDFKSTTGYMYLLGGTAVSWSSKKQESIAQSSAEAEYVAGASAANHGIWMTKILTDLKLKIPGPIPLMMDSKSAIAMTKNPTFFERSKHIDIKYHVLRSYVQKLKTELGYVSSEDQIADALTKLLYP